jgi:hypothetical protein
MCHSTSSSVRAFALTISLLTLVVQFFACRVPKDLKTEETVSDQKLRDRMIACGAGFSAGIRGELDVALRKAKGEGKAGVELVRILELKVLELIPEDQRGPAYQDYLNCLQDVRKEVPTITVRLPDNVSLKDAIVTLVDIDRSTPEFKEGCADSLLNLKVRGGEISAKGTIDLINQLPHRLINSDFKIKLQVTKFDERGIYEISCAH